MIDIVVNTGNTVKKESSLYVFSFYYNLRQSLVNRIFSGYKDGERSNYDEVQTVFNVILVHL